MVWSVLSSFSVMVKRVVLIVENVTVGQFEKSLSCDAPQRPAPGGWPQAPTARSYTSPGQAGAPKERFWLLGVECPGYTDPNLPRRQKESTRLKKALITGVTGQDGAYLAEFLLA